MKKRRNRLNLSDDEKSNIGCIVAIVAVVLFVVIYLIIKGISWDSVLSAFGIVSLSFWGVVGLFLGLLAIPVITVFYYAARNDIHEFSEKSCSWISPFISATFFILLYKLFRLLFGEPISDIISSLDFVEDFEKTSSIVSFVVFDVFVLIGCLYARKHPDIKVDDFIPNDMF